MSTAALSNWIKGQIDRDDPIGDIARDASVDPRWPDGADLDALREYLPEPLHRILEEAEQERRGAAR